jgi:uncharacterized protein
MTKATLPKRRRKPITLIVWISMGAIVIALLAFVMKDFFISKPTPHSMSQGSEQAQAADPFRNDGTVTFASRDGSRLTAIDVEIADNDRTRTQGLMGRTILHENRGMLFLFEDNEPRSFWMANTPLPLDILFIDTGFRIVKIHRNTRPFSEEGLESGAAARYVVEVNAGFCDRHGLSEGDSISWQRK